LRPVKGDPSAISPDAPAISRVREILSEAKQIFPGVELGLTGEPVLDADQVEASIVSVALASGIALTLIVSLFLMSYREATRPVLAVITLVVGTLWTFGAATLLVGHLNIISNAFVAMVLGLGIDFGIQLIGRYEEEISRGKKAFDALCCSVSCTGSAIIVGALTTTAAFFSMCFNDFTGLAELGIIAGLGVILCLAANFTLLPALIWLADRNRKNLQQTALASHWRGGFLLKEPGRKNPSVVIACAVVMSALTAFISVVFRAGNFDYNLLNLQNPDLESVRIEKKLIEKGQQSINYAVVVADHLDAARDIASQLTELPTVNGVASAADLIPSEQQSKIAHVENMVKLAAEICSRNEVDWNRTSITESLEKLFSASKDAIEQAEAFSSVSHDARDAYELLARLRTALQKVIASAQQLSEEEFLARTVKWDSENIGPVRSALQWIAFQDTSQITLEDIPPFLRKRWISPNGKFAVEIYPKENVWEREAAQAFVSEIRTIVPDVTGTPVMNLEYLFMLREAFVRAGLLAVAVILVVMLVHFRSMRLTVLALVPLVLAIIWTLGLMPVLGLKFNPANIITLPLTVGIGVAYGIYVVDRLREVRGGDLFDTSTAKSVWLSALTTIIGFGSLIQASYRGISSLGLLMTLSVGMCLLASLYVLPALTRRFLNYADQQKQPG
jgi:hopanoid biosynthesis associated RND transporter like protein HpnN